MNSNPSLAMSHLNVLANEIGERPAGTSSNHCAGAYIRKVFQDCGLIIDEVCNDFPDWSLVQASLVHDGQTFAVDVNPFSSSCDVNAPFVAVSTLPELEAAQMTGKIALLYGELSKAPIFPINFAPIQFERDQAINRLLLEKQPDAVLAINLHPYRRQHIFEDEDFTIPSATLSVEVGNYLLQHRDGLLHLHIDTRSNPAYVKTLVARTATTYDQTIVLCAHFDTKFGTPGAQDNGSGVASLLTLAQTLPQLALPINLEFVAWADEEYGAYTDTSYAEKTGDAFSHMICAINIDGIGVRTESTTITMLAQSEAFGQAVKSIVRGYSGVIEVDPWYASNHYTYFAKGVPCIALTSLTNKRTHQADDSIHWVDANKLDEVIWLVTEIVQGIHTYTPVSTRA